MKKLFHFWQPGFPLSPRKTIGANKDGRRKRLIASAFLVLYVRSSFEMLTLNRVIDSCVAHRQLEQLLRRLRDGWTLPRLQRPSLATSATYRKLNLIYVFLTADKLFFYLFAKHGLLRFTLDRCIIGFRYCTILNFQKSTLQFLFPWWLKASITSSLLLLKSLSASVKVVPGDLTHFHTIPRRELSRLLVWLHITALLIAK